jgi:quercetin dioxygenase-like cupin family protein
VTPQEFETMLQSEGYNSGVLVERAVGYHLDEHAHDFDACALVTEGDLTLVVDGVEQNYPAGSIFKLAAGTPHRESAGPQGVRYLSGRRHRVAT